MLWECLFSRDKAAGQDLKRKVDPLENSNSEGNLEAEKDLRLKVMFTDPKQYTMVYARIV